MAVVALLPPPISAALSETTLKALSESWLGSQVQFQVVPEPEPGLDETG